jgi:hypothetical protein
MKPTIPFSNSTEGDAWMSKWCTYCEHDHNIHTMGSGPGCDFILDAMLRKPVDHEAWIAEPDDGQFYLPSRMICVAFKPCNKDECQGDPAPDARATRITEVTTYWRNR